jgi:GTPase SAR1 family protein
MSYTFGIKWSIVYTGMGVIIGIALGSNLKFDSKEFRKAANNISIFSIIYATLSFLVLYLSSDQNNNSFIKDAFTILIFSFFFGKLMNYEARGPKIFVLGPAKSGKTMFLAGCYLRALNITEIPAKPSKDLLHLVDQLHSGEVSWPERTGTIYEYQFTYEIGTLFPRRTTLRTIDYPGVFLENISEYMHTKKDVKKMNEEEKRYAIAAREVANADSLIFILDGEKYPNFGAMGITHYIEIISKLNDSGKNIKPYIIVTKSDLFTEEFGNKEDYEGFKKFIEKKFSQNVYLKQLLNEASKASFFPVFYYTRKLSDEHIPMRDENGNVYTFGFDKFMDHLSED